MSHDDFAFDPIPGLPEALPAGEQILWQGRPDGWALAKQAMGLRWIALYFGVLIVWRITASAQIMDLTAAMGTAIPLALLGLLAVGILSGIAVILARATVYTITNRRVAMRIGAALPLTLNLPFASLDSAGLDARRNGTGTIALRMTEGSKVSYLVAWPHVRPWHMARTEPALRAIPNAKAVAELLAEAAETRLSEPEIEIIAPAGAVAAE